MSADLELSTWRAEWQAQTGTDESSSVQVRRSAIKQQRRLRTSHVLELLSGIFFMCASAAFAWKVRTTEFFVWAAVVWITTLIVSAFSVWNWSTLWRQDLKSVAEFSQVYEKRCVAKIRAARFGNWFVVVQILIAAPWLAWDCHRGDFSTARFAGAMFLMFLLSGVFWVMFSRSRRSALRELHGLQTLREIA